MKISDNKYVTVTYDLKVGEEQELMEQATTEKPLEFIFGTNTMLKAFEEQLLGKEEGDSFDFVISPDDAYGDYFDERVIEVAKSMFLVDGKIDNEMLSQGNVIPMMDAEGNRLDGSVVEVKDDIVVMDFNHPLAGEFMHFIGKVAGVRESTDEDFVALSSHSCGSGCGCGHGEEIDDDDFEEDGASHSCNCCG